MLLSLSHTATLTYLDALGKDYDKEVHEWKETIEKQMTILAETVLIAYMLRHNHKNNDGKGGHEYDEVHTASYISELTIVQDLSASPQVGTFGM